MGLRYIGIALGSLVLTGCLAPGMGNWVAKRDIAGGQTIDVVFGSHGPAPVEDADLIISHSPVLEFNPKDQTHAEYFFSFELKHDLKPTHVMVEDVSDDRAVTLVDDPHPQTMKKVWFRKSVPLESTSDKLAWLGQIDMSIRVYRFTIVDSGGVTHVLYPAASYPPFIKTFLRQKLGLEPAPKTAG
jgi:hypothetical protein